MLGKTEPAEIKPYRERCLRNTHLYLRKFSPQKLACVVTLGAPSKTFNIPGIVSAWTVVRSPRLREPFFGWLSASEFNTPDWVMGITYKNHLGTLAFYHIKQPVKVHRIPAGSVDSQRVVQIFCLSG